MIFKFFIWLFALFLVFNYLKGVRAQDTFGPICDDVTVTCIPTPSETPGPTAEETPTDTPADTPYPTELPQAGVTDSFNILILTAFALIIAGGITRLAFTK